VGGGGGYELYGITLLVPFETKERISDADTGGVSIEPRGTPTMEELVLKRR
jgi:hypothetical protein